MGISSRGSEDGTDVSWSVRFSGTLAEGNKPPDQTDEPPTAHTPNAAAAAASSRTVSIYFLTRRLMPRRERKARL